MCVLPLSGQNAVFNDRTVHEADIMIRRSFSQIVLVVEFSVFKVSVTNSKVDPISAFNGRFNEL